MESKRAKLMDQSTVENLIIYDSEEVSEIVLGEPGSINNLIEVVNSGMPEFEIENLYNPEEDIQILGQSNTINNLIEVEVGSCEPELQDENVDVRDGNLTDDEKFRDLLKSWRAPNFYDPLTSQGIDYNNLHSLEENDLQMLTWNGCLTIKDLIVFRNAHREWKKNLTQNLIDLKKILENRGDEITCYYKANAKLTDPLRERLVAIIIEGRVLSRAMMDNLADQICVIFPGETKSIYYDKEVNKNPTGLLYVRYSQSRTTKAIAKSVASASEMTASEDPTLLLSDDVQMSVDFVNDRSNFRDLSRTEELFEHWQKCFTYRYAKKYTAEEVLNEWPLLQEKDALPMVRESTKIMKFLLTFSISEPFNLNGTAKSHTAFQSILDYFLTKYGHGIANSLKTKWEDFIFKNFTVISDGIKNPKSKNDLRKSQSENDGNARDQTILMALHNLYYIVPTKCTVKKKTWTPTIPESQEAFLKKVNNSNSIANEMKTHKALYGSKVMQDHPIIFEVKNSASTDYFVCVCQTIYDCESLIDAVDSVFKFYVMFNIPFPPQCVKFWQFFNQFFYKIDLPQKPNFKMLSIYNSFQL